jgi:hypothetical protein
VLKVVIGITYGVLIAALDQWLLFYRLALNRRRGIEPLTGIGKVFLLRYCIDLVAMFLFAYVTRHGLAIVAAGLSITIAVKVSLFIVYVRKGGRFD